MKDFPKSHRFLAKLALVLDPRSRLCVHKLREVEEPIGLLQIQIILCVILQLQERRVDKLDRFSIKEKGQFVHGSSHRGCLRLIIFEAVECLDQEFVLDSDEV